MCLILFEHIQPISRSTNCLLLLLFIFVFLQVYILAIISLRVGFNPFTAGPEYFGTHTGINKIRLSIILGCRKLLKVDGPSLDPTAIKCGGGGQIYCEPPDSNMRGHPPAPPPPVFKSNLAERTQLYIYGNGGRERDIFLMISGLHSQNQLNYLVLTAYYRPRPNYE